jgi:sulfur transfer protein SufE
MDGLQAAEEEEEEEEEEETGCENAFWVQLGEEEESDYTLEVVAGEEV